MNWFLSKKLIRKITILLSFFLVSIFFENCNFNDNLGVKYELITDINTEFIEFDLSVSNTYIDSLRTDGEETILAGSHNDPVTGSVIAEGYFSYSYEGEGTLPVTAQTSTNPNPTDTLTYSSVVLRLEITEMITSDNQDLLMYDVYELSDSLYDVVYLSSLEQTRTNRIASFLGTFGTISDENGDALKRVDSEGDSIVRTAIDIEWDDQHGRQFFNLISSLLKDSTRSLSGYNFKDLAIVPPQISQAILAEFDISTSESKIILNMTGQAADTIYSVEFPIESTAYTHLKRDRSGSLFENIENTKNFILQDGRTFVDPLFGIYTSIDLTSLVMFFEDNPGILISNATLVMNLAEDQTNRKTLVNVTPFLRKKGGNIANAALSLDPFQNIVMHDVSYVNLEVRPAVGQYNEEKDDLLIGISLFLQNLFHDYHENDELLFTNPLNDDEGITIEGLTLMNVEGINPPGNLSPKDVTLQRSIFKNEGIKLRVFHTKID